MGWMLDTPERLELIALAEKYEPTTMALIGHGPAGPGKYEGADDLLLVVACEILYGNGLADETAGDTDGLGHGARFGRFVMLTDSQGFVSVERYVTQSDAEAVLYALEPVEGE